MANNLSLDTVIEKNKIASDKAFLVLLQIDVIDPINKTLVESIYLVHNNEDITYQGQVYSQFPFDINLKQESGSIPTITLTAEDLGQSIQARLQQYRGIVGSNVKVTVVNEGNLDQPPEIVEKFKVVGAGASSSYQVKLELGARNALAMPFPRRRQMRNRCSWEYKSAQCGYSGGLTTCDLTLDGGNGCDAHNNTENFGGFPGINSNLQIRS